LLGLTRTGKLGARKNRKKKFLVGRLNKTTENQTDITTSSIKREGNGGQGDRFQRPIPKRGKQHTGN